MKAVFLGNGAQIDRVYTKEHKLTLSGMLELYPEVIPQAALDGCAATLREAEIIFSTWGMPALTEEEIGKYVPNARIVFYGAGSVQKFARPFLSRGIRVVSAWAANAVPVTEFTASMIQLCLKGFFPAHHMAREDWAGANSVVCRHPGCFRSKVGLLGLGMIGTGVAEKLQGMDIGVIAYDPYAREEKFSRLKLKRAASLMEAFEFSDVVSNHIPDLPETREILRYEHFNALPEYGSFINTGRNAQVHVSGIVRALTEVPARTAVFDVTDPDEPPSRNNPLLCLPNAYFTPHMAGSTGREVSRMGAYMVDECKRYLAGESLLWEVTADMLETMA